MSKKLHVLFLSGWYPSRVLQYNGDFIQRHAEAVNLQNKVSVIHIISDKNVKDKIEYSQENINGIITYIAYIKPTRNLLIKGFRFYRAFKKLLNSIDNFDLVHLNILYPFGVFALYLKWFQKKSFIISEHWSGYHKKLARNIGFFQKMTSKIIAKNSSYITTVSNHLGNSMQDFGLKGNYKNIPNVVDTSFFTESTEREKQFTLVHISNMVEEYKNIAGILRVVKKLESEITDFKFKFIGAQPKKMISYAKELDINPRNYKFINHISQKEMITHLKKAHAFILFSTIENLPCVVLESFSCGTPVVATNVGGVSEYFPPKFGKIINKKNEEELYQAIIDVYNNPIHLENEMHKYAEENFGKRIICNQFTDLYKQVLN